jgi:hypothetical protein
MNKKTLRSAQSGNGSVILIQSDSDHRATQERMEDQDAEVLLGLTLKAFEKAPGFNCGDESKATIFML